MAMEGEGLARDAALAAAGLPILHVQAQRTYAPAELRAMVEDRMQLSESL